jgi:dimeric dUTPase (all-alpha-NTP-PPase superfamily)
VMVLSDFLSNFDVSSMPPVSQVSAFLLLPFSEIADYSFTVSTETEVLNIFSVYIAVPCDLHSANLFLNMAYGTKQSAYIRPSVLYWGGKSSSLAAQLTTM